MEEKEKKPVEHTEELPVVENVVWHREEEEDTLDKPVENEVHMTPIEADDPSISEKEEYHIGVEKTDTKKLEIKEDSPKKSNKKTWIIVGIVIVILIVGIGAFYFYDAYQKEQEAKKKAYDKMYDQLKVTFVEDEKDEDGNFIDPTLFEYGIGEQDAMKLVDTHYGDVTCNPEKIDLTKVGTQKILYTVTMKDSYQQVVSREFSLNVTVHDTQSPTITLANSKLTITEGDVFDAKENITSVIDPVDGELQYVESEPEKNNKTAPYYENGWYVIESDVDTEKPGSYSVRIKAYDKNGNAADVAYSVTVKQKDPTSFMTIATKTYTKALGKMTDSDAESAGETGDWKDVDSYLGSTLYKSETYTNQDEMMRAGQKYISENFDSLTKNKEKKNVNVIGDISIDVDEATLYYMEALDEDGNVMYYFYAIV